MKILANKLQGINEYCMQKGIETARCAHVGDGFNDVIAFRGVGVSIAFNSYEDGISEAATCAVRGDSLLDVYRALEPYLPTGS